jgi:hypothetical protein
LFLHAGKTRQDSPRLFDATRGHAGLMLQRSTGRSLPGAPAERCQLILSEKEPSMQTGLLWFDNSKDTLEQKVLKAAAYYMRKYGQTPDTCQIHPSMLAGKDTLKAGVVTIKTNRAVLPCHLWIGVDA